MLRDNRYTKISIVLFFIVQQKYPLPVPVVNYFKANNSLLKIFADSPFFRYTFFKKGQLFI